MQIIWSYYKNIVRSCDVKSIEGQINADINKGKKTTLVKYSNIIYGNPMWLCVHNLYDVDIETQFWWSTRDRVDVLITNA